MGLALGLIVAIFLVQVFAENSGITLNCKYHKHSSYACIVLGFENHVANVTVSQVKGNHIKGKSNSDIVELVIKDQNASFVPINVKDYFPNIISYEVKNSSLTDIARNYFAGLKKIETVVLVNNLLKTLNSDVFNDLNNLKHIRLSGNQLTKLHFKLFANNADLEVIMFDNNAIDFVHELLFENLVNVKELYLQNNKIVDLRDRTFRKNKNLELLDLSNNKLKSIGPKLFEGLENVKTFDFSNNTCVQNGFKTIDELVAEIENSCFPPDFVRYEEEIKSLKEAQESANETLTTCQSDLEDSNSSKTDLEAQVEKANEEKSSLEGERDSCNEEKEALEKEVEELKKEREDKKSEYEELAKNLTLCETSHGSTMETFRIIDTLLDRTNNTIDKCLYKVSVLEKALALSKAHSGNGEKEDSNQVSTLQADKAQLITERDDVIRALQNEKEVNEKLRKENEGLQRRIEELAAGNQNVATTSDAGECKNLLQETKTQLLSRESDLRSCMSQLPLCSSFYIDCLFASKEVNNEETYTCKAKHVQACQPGMKLASVDGIHLSGKTNNHVNVLEIQDSMFQFTNDVFKQLPYLRKFYIKNSGLSSLQPQLRSSSLRELDIEENKFGEIPERSFEGVSKLEKMLLDNNWIETISAEAFVGLSSLNDLSLKDNQIRELPLGVFDHLRSLTHLSLKNNFVTSLHGDIFKQNTRLEVVQFDNNKELMTVGMNLLDFSRSWRLLHFAGTCVGDSNDSSLQDVRNKIFRNCQNK